MSQPSPIRSVFIARTVVEGVGVFDATPWRFESSCFTAYQQNNLKNLTKHVKVL